MKRFLLAAICGTIGSCMMLVAAPVLKPGTPLKGAPGNELVKPSIKPEEKDMTGDFRKISPAEVSENTFEVKCVFKYDTAKYRPSMLTAYNMEEDEDEYYDYENDYVYLYLPAGTYDFRMEFYRLSEKSIFGEEGMAYLILEDIEVDRDMEVELDASLITESIRFETYNPDGEKSALRYIRYLNENYDWEIISEYNVYDFYCDNYIIHKDYGMYNMHSNAGGVEVEAGPCGEWKSEWASTIYINPVSDKYQIAQMRMLYNDDECWIVPMFADGSKTQIVTNEGAAYSDLTDVTFRKSPSGEKCETISSSPYAMNWGMGTAGIAPSSMWGVQSSLASFHHVRYCPTASSELHPEYGCLMTFGGEDSAEIIDKYVDYDDEGNIIHEEVIYSTKNIVSPYFSLGMERNTGLPYIDNRFLSTKTGGIDMDNSFQMPVSYCVSSETMPVLGSSPQFLRFFYLTYDSQWYDYPYPLFAYDSCGFYGESRNDGDISIELNGRRIVSSSQELAEWQMKCMESAMEFGKLVFNYRNDNIEIDGLPGVNTAVISIDTSLDDYTAPLIQSVQFRDSNDRVIERFTQPSDGRLIVAGGDFQENYGSGLNVFGETPLWYEVEDCVITVEYSPYGDSDYQPLEVIRENEPMSGFGFPYVASLDCVDRNSVSGWFDIRITMSDASGNSHQQVISPAFHMDSLTGVQSVSLNKSNLHVSDGMVVSDDGADVEVSTISGRRVENSNLSPGIYIARGGESVAKLIVR